MAGYIVAITGASGAIYGLRLVEEFLKRGDDVRLIISTAGFLLLKHEAAIECDPDGDVTGAVLDFFKKSGMDEGGLSGTLTYSSHDDLMAPFASGSSLDRVMVICPASMGTIARVATGVSSNLIERAADCVLKEGGGKLVVVPRETPLNTIHLENLLKLAKAGATVLPAMPAFYSRPKTVYDMVDFIVGKVLDQLGIENDLYARWKGGAPTYNQG